MPATKPVYRYERRQYDCPSSYVAPGRDALVFEREGIDEIWVFKQNFEEFVRVNFNNEKITSRERIDGFNLQWGTRASDTYDWKSSLRLIDHGCRSSSQS